MSDIDPSTLSPDALQAHLDAMQASADAAQASANAQRAHEDAVASQALITAQNAEIKANGEALLAHAAAIDTRRGMALQMLCGWPQSTLKASPDACVSLALLVVDKLISKTPATPNNPNGLQ